MNPYKKLIGNSALFAIGNLGSKLISILLVPLYTYYLTTAEYGTVDITISTSSMLLPIISLSIYEALLRFIMDKTHDNEMILTNGVYITIVGSIIIIFIYPFLMLTNILGDFLSYMIAILVIQAFQTLFAQYTRAIGNIRIYALNGIIMSIIIGFFNLLFLVKLDWGIDGYFISVILSNIISVIFLMFSSKIYNHIKLNKYNTIVMKSMLLYSLPLIPNSFMWWVINASNRYFIYNFVGSSANGLFAVANKIPSLLSILSTIFFQAWQLSAIEEYTSAHKSKIYSNVFNYFSFVMLLSVSIILVPIKFLVKISVHNDFYQSWRVMPFLLLGVMFSSFSGFLGTNYIAAKETKGVFKTSIYGGVLSLTCNFIFIPTLGLNGAGISTMLSFFIIWIIRIKDTKKFIEMRIDKKNIFWSIVIIMIQIFILFIEFSWQVELPLEVLLFSLVLIINRKYFIEIIEIIK